MTEAHVVFALEGDFYEPGTRIICVFEDHDKATKTITKLQKKADRLYAAYTAFVNEHSEDEDVESWEQERQRLKKQFTEDPDFCPIDETKYLIQSVPFIGVSS